jgi:hypothetical protein
VSQEIVFETEGFHIGLHPGDVGQAGTSQLPTKMQVDNEYRSKTRYGGTGPVYVNVACIYGKVEGIRYSLYISRWPNFHLCIMNNRRNWDDLLETTWPGAIWELDQQIVGGNLFESIFH